jgi:hypothetical protein
MNSFCSFHPMPNEQKLFIWLGNEQFLFIWRWVAYTKKTHISTF